MPPAHWCWGPLSSCGKVRCLRLLRTCALLTDRPIVLCEMCRARWCVGACWCAPMAPPPAWPPNWDTAPRRRRWAAAGGCGCKLRLGCARLDTNLCCCLLPAAAASAGLYTARAGAPPLCTTHPAQGVSSRAYIEGGSHNANFDGLVFYPRWSLPGWVGGGYVPLLSSLASAWAAGLLGCWAAGLLGCWAAGLLGCTSPKAPIAAAWGSGAAD